MHVQLSSWKLHEVSSPRLFGCLVQRRLVRAANQGRPSASRSPDALQPRGARLLQWLPVPQKRPFGGLDSLQSRQRPLQVPWSKHSVCVFNTTYIPHTSVASCCCLHATTQAISSPFHKCFPLKISSFYAEPNNLAQNTFIVSFLLSRAGNTATTDMGPRLSLPPFRTVKTDF